jgi:hypothetical protein
LEAFTLAITAYYDVPTGQQEKMKIPNEKTTPSRIFQFGAKHGECDLLCAVKQRQTDFSKPDMSLACYHFKKILFRFLNCGIFQRS